MMDIVGWWILVPAGIGFGIGALTGRWRYKAWFALAATVLPPAAAVLLYALASRTGCAGGDCMGPMIAMMLVLGLAGLVSLTGAGLLLQALLTLRR